MKWNGFRLLGVDGSTLHLPDGDNQMESFGFQSTPAGRAVMGRVLCCFDVLNHISVYTCLSSFWDGESKLLVPFLKDKAKKDDLLIYDRGFPSFALIYLHNLYGLNYVMRCKLSFNNQVKAFVESGLKDQIIHIKSTEKGRKLLKELGHSTSLNDSIRLRLVRVELKNGETEVLMTSLTDQEAYQQDIFSDLYFMRWGVEVYFDRLKNLFLVENFSGRSVNSIYQEFYAAVFLSSIQGLLLLEADRIAEQKTQGRKFPYKASRAISLGLLKMALPRLWASPNPQCVANELIEKFAKNLEPVRKGRSYPRKRKKANKGPKVTNHSNYRPVL